MPDLQTVRGTVSAIQYLRKEGDLLRSSPPATATAMAFKVGEQPAMAMSSSGNAVRSDLPPLNEGDDVEIAGVSNSRNQWLEAARVHNHTTGATWELSVRRVATGGCLPVALALLLATAVLVLW
jgi:hypothetical protein